MVLVPVTLATAAACVALNIWLGGRIAAYRQKFKVSVGDGGQEPLLRRMRAQANFIENAPFVLVLIGALELMGGNRSELAGLGIVFLAARIAHAIGMDGAELRRWRGYGMIATTFVNVALVIWAIVRVAQLASGR
jgi:uncharacterized membrane protein YecN with MAPEG domain